MLAYDTYEGGEVPRGSILHCMRILGARPRTGTGTSSAGPAPSARHFRAELSPLHIPTSLSLPAAASTAGGLAMDVSEFRTLSNQSPGGPSPLSSTCTNTPMARSPSALSTASWPGTVVRAPPPARTPSFAACSVFLNELRKFTLAPGRRMTSSRTIRSM